MTIFFRMFKIQENPDGSTSVICKNSGNILCTVPKNNNNGPRRQINVVEPQPINNAGSSVDFEWNNIKREKSSDEADELKGENQVKAITRQSKCCISPIPISFDGDQNEDYFDDYISLDEFAKCLNLISKEKLQTQPRETLLAEYPLRLLSKSKAYRTLEDSPHEDLKDLKLPDDMPLTSNLGIKILHLNENRNFLSESKRSMSLKRYDNYCRMPFNTNKPSTCNFPKLRCREKKTYPISTLLKSSKHQANHFYTYGKRQRTERMITLRTGLNTKSRRLLKLCEKKKFSIMLKRLSNEEIKTWKKKSLPSSSLAIIPSLPEQILKPSTLTSDNSTLTLAEIYARIPSGTSLLKVKPQNSHSKICFNKLLEQKKKQCQRFSIKLMDVTKNICKRTDGYYFKDTLIRVSFSEDTLSLLKVTESPNHRKDAEKNNLKVSNCNHHASHSVSKAALKTSVAKTSKAMKLPLNSIKNVIQKNPSKKLETQESASDIINQMAMQKPSSSTLKSILLKHKTSSEPIKAILIQKTIANSTQELLNERKSKIVSGLRTASKHVEHRKPKADQNSIKSHQPSSEATVKDVKFGDLTDESSLQESVGKESMPKEIALSRYKFNCFGCGLKYFYVQQSTIVEKLVKEHLEKYHSVLDPESFFTRVFDRANQCTIIEAFPSFKDQS
ncbi:uncharacterized protein CEXT_484911 [Caerostris extrusa]|uniref:Uncharacterized protein n=1 Tax=Caerostris extrusa TaxID=172846 RepID=A0AAV4SHW8_CAEEX|nr:uncharacterized protein CEXT_484911 [Caerostris extrusa]